MPPPYQRQQQTQEWQHSGKPPSTSATRYLAFIGCRGPGRHQWQTPAGQKAVVDARLAPQSPVSPAPPLKLIRIWALSPQLQTPTVPLALDRKPGVQTQATTRLERSTGPQQIHRRLSAACIRVLVTPNLHMPALLLTPLSSSLLGELGLTWRETRLIARLPDSRRLVGSQSIAGRKQYRLQ